MLFTTSWDDGHTLDCKIHDILCRHGATGTLYVCPTHPMVQSRLSDVQMKELSQSMEIGAHTMTHPDLTAVSLDQAKKEITESKKWIEDITGKPCTMFCYPRGRFNPVIAAAVKEAGYNGARTTQWFRFSGNDPFTLPVSLQVYPHPLRMVPNRRMLEPLQLALKGTRGFGIRWYEHRSWLSFAKATFRYALATKQPWFHLFGHSWEVEKFGMWDQLDEFLRHVASHHEIKHVRNSALLSV